MPENTAMDTMRDEYEIDTLIEQATPILRRYILTLEQENARLRQELMDAQGTAARRERAALARESREPSANTSVPTPRYGDDVMVITVTAQGLCKRTPVNEYSAQRRGGVGVFDIQTSRDDQVAHVLVAREAAALLVLSSRGRAFRVPVETLPLTEIRGRGASLPERLMFTGGETIGALLALDEEQDDRPNVLIATASGLLRSFHRNYVGPRLQPGTLLVEPARGGSPAAATLSHGGGDVLVALRSGVAYRFAEQLIRREGVRGIQVRPDDAVVGLAVLAADGSDAIFLASGEGLGTRRGDDTFSANKSPGGQGKVIMKTDALAGLAAVTEQSEVFCVSGLGKIIRFAVAEVPPKAGNVQGVNIMDCRGDQLTAITVSTPPAQD
ncbi:MAG: hypothetical protein KDI07_04840 [Anaerolineae bacterium]|nr:hypothetical protein [Anaerolineae bacterium]MCB9129694.1 hypothetical protein [Anaerolineales bacterium]MCB0239394.1 hypothetical protein [Anaerolineae bacterium]MCB0243951.1 hypothetical protein [Anaerolineae bacterium]MCB0247883.1 hypothetical protein [Anaerolineae bacterium]